MTDNMLTDTICIFSAYRDHCANGRSRVMHLFLEDHAFHVALGFVMSVSPVDGEHGGLEELLVGVLLANVLLAEAVLDELLYEHRVAREEMLLREAGVVNERSVLQKQTMSVT